MLGIKHATTTIISQSGLTQSSGFREGLTDSSELPFHKVLAHVRAQLNGSDGGAFHKAVYPRARTEKQGMYVTIHKYLQMCICIQTILYVVP